jgi:hypothetical protein
METEAVPRVELLSELCGLAWGDFVVKISILPIRGIKNL